jgi:hypothetical protein
MYHYHDVNYKDAWKSIVWFVHIVSHVLHLAIFVIITVIFRHSFKYFNQCHPLLLERITYSVVYAWKFCDVRAADVLGDL